MSTGITPPLRILPAAPWSTHEYNNVNKDTGKVIKNYLDDLEYKLRPNQVVHVKVTIANGETVHFKADWGPVVNGDVLLMRIESIMEWNK